jgi:hypothetical protein
MSEPLHDPVCTWASLEGSIASEIVQAPKTGGDEHGAWVPVAERVVRYLQQRVVGSPWVNHLALVAAVMSARHYDVQSVKLVVSRLHMRFTAVFHELALQRMDEWKAEAFFPSYLKGELLSQDSDSMRERFWIDYSTASKQVWLWLKSLPDPQQHLFQRFALPLVPRLAVHGLLHFKELQRQQQQARKQETDALVPHFAAMRAQAHLRYNCLIRLRQAYQEAIARAKLEQLPFPVEFSYEEGFSRWHFRLWDRRSFVLARAHCYSRQTVTNAKEHLRGFSDEGNTLFVEFVKATSRNQETTPSSPWFAELLRLGLLGDGPVSGTDEEVQAKQAWLRKFGYADPERGDSTPFQTMVSGLLCWSHDPGDASFMARAQERAEGLLIPVEPLYAAATFGLLALDLLTTTGLRINELMQTRVSKDCLVRQIDDPPPGAKDRSVRVRYLFRLIPKGEKTEAPRNYFIGKETLRLVEKTGRMLMEHYHLGQSEALPLVPFAPTNGRAHRFAPAPYLFQYRHRHLDGATITACMRFLLHGMVFQTNEGKPVVLKAHLLRHTFATYAVQVAQVPIDIVAEWLKQKDLEVTRYYSRVPESFVAEEHGTFVTHLALQVDVREVFLRSAKEIREQLEAAKRCVGTLIPVTGGECTLDGRCPSQFACIGCPAKTPDPAKRYQVEHLRKRGQEKLEYCQQEGLVLEVERLKQLIHHCEIELLEMDAIEHYREDETHAPTVIIE